MAQSCVMAGLRGELILQDDDGLLTLPIGDRAVRFSDQMHGKLALFEQLLDLLDKRCFVSRQRMVGKHTVAVAAQLGVESLARVALIEAALGEIDRGFCGEGLGRDG